MSAVDALVELVKAGLLVAGFGVISFAIGFGFYLGKNLAE